MSPTPNDHDPRRRFAGQPDEPSRTEEATFRLGPPVPPPVPDPGPDPAADPGEPTRATVLDPDSWSSEVSYGTASGTPGPPAAASAAGPAAGLRRFGPGVPGPDTSAATAHTAAVWHGTVRPGDPVPPSEGGGRHRRRAWRRWLLPLLVLLAVLAYLGWQRLPDPVKLDAVSVRNSASAQGCHSTAHVVGTLRTSGGAGTVHYRWRRSDGTVSAELTQHVPRGRRTTSVVLLWTFDGPGDLQATATLDILKPGHRTAATTFPYHCP